MDQGALLAWYMRNHRLRRRCHPLTSRFQSCTLYQLYHLTRNCRVIEPSIIPDKHLTPQQCLGKNRLSIVWRMVFKSLGSSTGPRGTNCLKSMGCGAKSIPDICLVGLRDRGDVAELRAEEVKCCEASSRKDNRTVGLKGRGVFSVSLPRRSVSCLLRLFKGEGVRAGS